MNVGQVLEVHLGWAAKGLGQRVGGHAAQQATTAELRTFLEEVYNTAGHAETIKSLSDADFKAMPAT